MTTSKWTPKYLEKIKATRGPRKPGEIFILKWKDLGYFFGRVVTDRVAMSPTPDSPPSGPWPHRDGNYLVYIYADPHPAPDPVPRLDRDRLIIPPVVVLNSPWTSGFFAPVAHQPLTSRDVLRRHCFWFVEATDHLIDEMGIRFRGWRRCIAHGSDLDHTQNFVFFDRSFRLYLDLDQRSSLGRMHGDFHFHGFEDHDDVVFSELIANRFLDFPNGTGDFRLNFDACHDVLFVRANCLAQ